MASLCIQFDSKDAMGRALSMMLNRNSSHTIHIHDLLRNVLSIGIITIGYVKSKDNVSSLLTKRPNYRES